jgi:virginiamycin A acetyltransferase
MENNILPDLNIVFSVPNINTVTYIKPTIKNKNIIVGDFTYFSDVDFENHVTHFYEFYGDKLIIGKFCQIASGVEFIMNGVNHQRIALGVTEGRTYIVLLSKGYQFKISD